MKIKINDNKNVFSSIVCEVNGTVFFYKYYKHLKRKIKTPQVTYTHTICANKKHLK